MTLHLLPSEIAVLRALEDGRPRAIFEISSTTDLPYWTVKSTLKELHRHRLVGRGRTMVDVGGWWITEHGSSQLRILNQLKVVD